MNNYDLPQGYEFVNDTQGYQTMPTQGGNAYYPPNDMYPPINHNQGNLPMDNNGTDFLSSEFLFGNVGAPFVIGLAVGYFAKKMLKLALFLGGAAIVLLFVTEYYGITQVNDNQLQNVASSATEFAKHSGSFLVDRLSHITSKGVSAAAGFFVGLKMG